MTKAKQNGGKTKHPRRLTRERACCPKCGKKTSVIQIVWGLPTPETERKADRGDLVLGGCCVGPSDPTHYCRACEHSFGNRESEENGDSL